MKDADEPRQLEPIVTEPRMAQDAIEPSVTETEHGKDSGGCACHACRRRYKIDVLVPDELWHQIQPSGSRQGGGLLCGGCIFKALESLHGYGAYRISDV